MDNVLSDQHRRYEVLDGMRGVAAINVMIYHFTQTRVERFTRSIVFQSGRSSTSSAAPISDSPQPGSSPDASSVD
jgi:peptidoglycan/LPS O-acetylase OafA/YrhL